MSRLKEYIHDNTIADADITAEIGDRMYVMRAPRTSTTRPYIVWRETGSEHGQAFSGPTGLNRHEYELNIVADTPDAATTVAAALEDKWAQFRGNIGPVGDIGPQMFVSSFLRRQYDVVLAPVDGSGQGQFVIVQDYAFWAKE